MRKVHPNHPTLRNPKFAKEVFDASRQPRAWYTVAQRLRRSAEAIFARENPVARRFYDELHRIGGLAAEGKPPEDFDETKFPFPNFDAAYMLIAFAIENLLKGILVARGLVTFSKEEVPKPLKTHDLRKLHELASPTATIPTYALDTLSYMGDWRGRYPLPTSVEKFWPMNDDGTMRGAGYSWPQFHTDFFAYCDGLEAELRSLM